MTVLTQTEAEDLAAAYEWAKSTGDPEPFNAVLDAAVERIVAARPVAADDATGGRS